MSPAELPAIDELMPHRRPVMLLDQLVAYDAESTSARVELSQQRWLRRDDGSVGSWLAMEYMAQCAALHEGIQAYLAGSPPSFGVIASVSGLELERPYFEASEILWVRASRQRGSARVGAVVYRCSISSGEELAHAVPVAKGRLCIAVPRAVSAA